MPSLNFNSIKVRLEQTSCASMPCSMPFQFHKGAIRTAHQGTTERRCTHFNSIKVRLEPLPPNITELVPLFQFHKGAIRTTHSLPNKISRWLFQFHKGAIRTPHRQGGGHNQIYFNSIKVRLEQRPQAPRLHRRGFQFHKGAIRTFPFLRTLLHQLISIP